MSADEAFLTTDMSGGVASYPNLADNERELIRNAHAALFRAKTGGRAPLFRNRSAWNRRPSTLAPASSVGWGSSPI